MKQIFSTTILFVFFLCISHAQQVKKIRNIDLDVPLHEIEEDYGLTIGQGNIIPIHIFKKEYDQRVTRSGNELVTELKFESTTTFDKNLKKVKFSKVTRKGNTTTYNFSYDSQGRLIKYWSVGARYGDTYLNLSYQEAGNFILTQSFKDDGAGIKSIYTKTDYGYVTSGDDSKNKIIAENNLVKKVIYGYDQKNPSETLISHNKNGEVIKRETSFATLIFEYNSKGDQAYFKETSKRNGSTTSRTYAYKYDKYGNWIIKVDLLDMSAAKGIPSFPNPTLREIKYSNGEVTGTTDLNKVESYLITLRKQVSNINSVVKTKFSDCRDLKCLANDFAIKSLRCSMEASCSGKEWSEILNEHIITLESLNISEVEKKDDFIDRINTVKLYNFWGIYHFLQSDAASKYKDLTKYSFDKKKQILLGYMGLYLENGNLTYNLPVEQLSIHSYDTYNNALEIYKLDQKQNEALKKIEAQAGIKQTTKASNIDIEKVLPKLIAPENRTAFWKKTKYGFDVYLTFGASVSGKTEVINQVMLGDHLICTDKVLGSIYVLRDFKLALLSETYEVLVYKKTQNVEHVLWVKKGLITKMYKSGKVYDVVAKETQESPVDRLVNLNSENYILSNYVNAKNNTVQYATKLSAQGLALSQQGNIPSQGTYWKHYDNFYYLVKDGKYIDFEVQHNFKGNDAVAYHSKSNKSYILRNYYANNDGKWREAITVNADQAVWIKYENGTFNCYEKAVKNLSKNEWSKENSNDLWMMDYNNKPKYVLKNYKNATPNTFFIAERYGVASNNKVTNTTQAISNTSSVKQTTSNYIADKVKRYFKTANGDPKQIAKSINNDYRKLMDTLSGDALYAEGAKYFMALNNIHPSLPFNIFMKWEDVNSINPIKEKLPKEVQDNITKAAQGLIDGYNKHINSIKN